MNATQLQEFVAEFDAQIAINVQFDAAAWPIDHLTELLESLGFSKEPTGSMRMWDIDALSLSINPDCVALTLNVPLSSPDKNPFGRMIQYATCLANWFQGSLVDDAGQPLSHSAIDEIQAQVAEFYSRMDAAGIPAGSPEAIRLIRERRGQISNPTPSRYRYSLGSVFFGFLAGWNMFCTIDLFWDGRPIGGALMLGAACFTTLMAFWPDKQARDGGKPV